MVYPVGRAITRKTAAAATAAAGVRLVSAARSLVIVVVVVGTRLRPAAAVARTSGRRGRAQAPPARRAMVTRGRRANGRTGLATPTGPLPSAIGPSIEPFVYPAAAVALLSAAPSFAGRGDDATSPRAYADLRLSFLFFFFFFTLFDFTSTPLVYYATMPPPPPPLKPPSS